MLEQLHSQLHVWIARRSEDDGTWSATGETLVRHGDESLLSDAERTRWQRYIRPADRDVFLAAHVLVRRTLSRYLDLAPQHWTFDSNEHGRPEITNPESPKGLRFNLSHTEGMVALLVHDTLDCGVDVERVGRVRDFLQMAETVFADVELSELLALPTEGQEDRFYELWTLKEAFIKAKGMGLAIELKDFWLSRHDNDDWLLGSVASVDREPGAWSFTVSRPSPIHLLSTACRTGTECSAREVKVFDIH